MARLSTIKNNSYHRGLWAEFLAAWFLRFKGYRVLARRYKTSVGEIDLIVRRRNMLVFVEVKARTDISDALESVTPKMKNRIRRAAEFYLSQNPQRAGMDMRFDLVALALPFQIRHLDNAW